MQKKIQIHAKPLASETIYQHQTKEIGYFEMVENH